MRRLLSGGYLFLSLPLGLLTEDYTDVWFSEFGSGVRHVGSGIRHSGMNAEVRQLSFLPICVNMYKLFYLSLSYFSHSQNKDNENFIGFFF